MRLPLPENVMALALLEMTEITNGDVLEQLLVVSAGEAAPRPHQASVLWSIVSACSRRSMMGCLECQPVSMTG
ncbi:hypothetical protein FJP69_19555 [Stenotrophomonas maltophilia]|nr:hypothetical protein FJP69_19555 [Stenotrophomonas maltophilia]